MGDDIDQSVKNSATSVSSFNSQKLRSYLASTNSTKQIMNQNPTPGASLTTPGSGPSDISVKFEGINPAGQSKDTANIFANSIPAVVGALLLGPLGGLAWGGSNVAEGRSVIQNNPDYLIKKVYINDLPTNMTYEEASYALNVGGQKELYDRATLGSAGDLISYLDLTAKGTTPGAGSGDQGESTNWLNGDTITIIMLAVAVIGIIIAIRAGGRK